MVVFLDILADGLGEAFEVVHHEDLGVAFVAFEAAPEEVFVDPVVALEVAFASLEVALAEEVDS